LQALAHACTADELLVCTSAERNVAKSFHVDIETLARSHGCPLVEDARLRKDALSVVNEFGVDRILCVGWPYLIEPRVIDQLAGQVYVAHDALLPKLRGFAPLATALIAGHQETGVTFFEVGAGLDDGPVLWQGRVTIAPDDTIASLLDKISPLYAEGARHIALRTHGLPQAQDESAATYSIWRDREDYRIDWNWDAARIERSVRALGYPYLGARTTILGRELILDRVSVVPDLSFAIRQPGKVWNLLDGQPSVVCGQGMIRIEAAHYDGGESALPFTRLRRRLGA
jgi:methionyl-tRNA formyltransferase